MYKEMLKAICEGVSEEVAKEIFMKISSTENTASNFDPKKPLDVTEDKKDDASDVNGKLFHSDHEARSYLRSNGFKEDSAGRCWVRNSNVAHILFKNNDERFKTMLGIVSRAGYEIVVQ